MYYELPPDENKPSTSGHDLNSNRRFLPIFNRIPMDDYPLIEPFLDRLTEQQAKDFLRMYQENRLDSQTYIGLSAMGVLGLFGAQRFYVGEWVMGILQLLTCGFFLIGTIYDMATAKTKINEINLEKARGIFSNYGNPYEF